jgi:D-alanine-D-alanine ligase
MSYPRDIMSRTRVILLFGGRSAEHEVSILSARNILRALDRRRFEPVCVGIGKDGRWRIEPEARLEAATGDPRSLRLSGDGPEVAVPVHPRSDGAELLRRDDVVFPVLHGTYGEDGTIQGLFELADVAYVGSGPLGSAIGMDKEVAKRLLSQAGLPVVPWRTLTAAAHARDVGGEEARAAEVGFPLFVKPANSGSSIGVSKVRDAAELGRALREAFAYDRKALAEAAVDAREIECAVLGNEAPEASNPGEIVVTHRDGFYSYEAKYVDPDGATPRIPAEIPAELAERVRRLSIETFRVLELSGMARVDFFLDRRSSALYVNEVNTLPGFTAISMYPKLWAASGLSQEDLVTRLIALAVERRAQRRALRTTR